MALEIGVAAEVGGRAEEEGLDFIGPSTELGPDREEGCNGTGHVGGSHACPAVGDVMDRWRVAVRLAPRGTAVGLGLGASGGTREDAFARGDEVGFDAAVAGRPFGREVRDPVAVRLFGVSRADGDRALGVAGVVDGEIKPHLRNTGVGLDSPVARVARGGNDNNAGTDEEVDLLAERGVAAGVPLRVKFVADAKVDPVDADVASSLIEFVNVTEGRDGIAGEPVAVIVEECED